MPMICLHGAVMSRAYQGAKRSCKRLDQQCTINAVWASKSHTCVCEYKEHTHKKPNERYFVCVNELSHTFWPLWGKAKVHNAKMECIRTDTKLCIQHCWETCEWEREEIGKGAFMSCDTVQRRSSRPSVVRHPDSQYEKQLVDIQCN